MKIAVLGAAGFPAASFCDVLAKNGHEVSRLPAEPAARAASDPGMAPGVIADRNSLAGAIAGADMVFNYASFADMPAGDSTPVDIARHNIMGNVLALEACREAGISRYVFAYPLYAYGRSGGFCRCAGESCEIYIENYHSMYNLSYTILRYGFLYGATPPERDIISKFTQEALDTGRIRYYGSPADLREYVHVNDAAAATLAILAPECRNRSIIIGSGQPVRADQLFRMIGDILGRELIIEYLANAESSHYQITPYVFMPKIGRKLIPPLTVDLGQGILRVLEEEHRALHPQLASESGYLVDSVMRLPAKGVA